MPDVFDPTKLSPMEYANMFIEIATKGDAERDAGLTTPEDIVRYDDIQYGADPKWQVMDLYRPKAAEGKKLPVIISFHGGGWVYGHKGVYQFYCMNLAQHGFAVLNFTYRLAPDYKYPAPLEDMNSVVTWMMENAEKYGLDTDHVFAVGDSAGGHGLGSYAAFTSNPEFAAHFDFAAPKGFKFSAVALNCGAYSLKKDDKLRQVYFPEDGDDSLLNVYQWVTKNYPPTYLMTANMDFLRDMPPVMEKALTEAQVPFVMACYGTEANPLGHVFHCNIKDSNATLCNNEEIAFFKRYL